MRIAILGVGAIGGLLAARLIGAGTPVTLVERPARAATLRARGLRFVGADGGTLRHEKLHVLDGTEREPHDVVLLAVKAHEIESALPALDGLLHADTVIVTLQNGLPWSYFLRGVPPALAGHTGRTLASVDPRGRLAAAIDVRRIVGCVSFPAAELLPDGAVRHVEGERFTLGEPDGTRSDRVQALAALLAGAGFKAPVTYDIRAELWLKNWGNLCFNPISALTGATLAGICRHAPTRELATAMMAEAREVAAALGVQLRVSLERRLAGAEAVGEHRTSMLQDLEHGRPLEHAALLGTVIEMAALTGVPVPTLRTVEALVSLRDPGRARTAAA